MENGCALNVAMYVVTIGDTTLGNWWRRGICPVLTDVPTRSLAELAGRVRTAIQDEVVHAPEVSVSVGNLFWSADSCHWEDHAIDQEFAWLLAQEMKGRLKYVEMCPELTPPGQVSELMTALPCPCLF